MLAARAAADAEGVVVSLSAFTVCEALEEVRLDDDELTFCAVCDAADSVTEMLCVAVVCRAVAAEAVNETVGVVGTCVPVLDEVVSRGLAGALIKFAETTGLVNELLVVWHLTSVVVVKKSSKIGNLFLRLPSTAILRL